MSSDGGNAAVDPEVDYIAAETFEGAKEGYTFTTHNSDVGYYKEGFTPEAIAPDAIPAALDMRNYKEPDPNMPKFDAKIFPHAIFPHVYNGPIPSEWILAVPSLKLPQAADDPTVAMLNAAMGSCVTRTAISYIGGLGMGMVFGLFMAGLDTPGSRPQLTPGGHLPPPGTPAPTISPMLAQTQFQGVTFKDVMRSTGKRAWSTGKSFAMIGALYAGSECAIADYTGREGLTTAAQAGCVSGGVLGLRAGIGAAATGCVGFAAFSIAIEAYMKGGI